jgi:hypothetical protein
MKAESDPQNQIQEPIRLQELERIRIMKDLLVSEFQRKWTGLCDREDALRSPPKPRAVERVYRIEDKWVKK